MMQPLIEAASQRNLKLNN